jgi:hypothetical protein
VNLPVGVLRLRVYAWSGFGFLVAARRRKIRKKKPEFLAFLSNFAVMTLLDSL